MTEHRLNGDDIRWIRTLVHQGAIDALGAVTTPATVHQAKFSMGSVLGLIAHDGAADLVSFESVLERDDVARFHEKVTMERDADVDEAYPDRWIGKVIVETVDGRTLSTRVDEPKGDPGNMMNRAEITAKAISLAQFGGAHGAGAAADLIDRLWRIAQAEWVGKCS